ncbi:MAG TPA: hypothetical protein VGB22_10345 [candidate division Zixibacteria bacterium]|jgi:hypothetical protein
MKLPEPEFRYLEESDIMFIGLGSDEPSYSEEVDEIVLVERGLFTNDLTGFRLLGYKQHDVNVAVGRITRIIEREPSEIDSRIASKKKALSWMEGSIVEYLRTSAI